MKPEYVDNRDGNTMAAAIGGHLEWLAGTYKAPLRLDVATGYFNPGAFAQLAEPLEGLASFRLLLGTEPVPAMLKRRKRIEDPHGRRFEEELFKKTLREVQQVARDELNFLGFTGETDALLKRLVTFLRSGKAEVRLYGKGFLHGKAFIFMGDEGVLAGSSNFTEAGLTANRELNLGQYQPGVVQQVRGWFDQHWAEAEPYDLASFFEARYREYSPHVSYLRALRERYGKDLRDEADESPDNKIHLTTFQNDGLDRAQRILDEYKGVLIADGVGLGKSYLAGELIRRSSQELRQDVLLVAPAALRDGMWRAFADRHKLYLNKVSFEELIMDPQLNLDADPQRPLRVPPERYSMVVVDEAHAFRNPDTVRARALRRLLQGTPPKKLVLVTATPVNNSLWDLYYLLKYFIGHDAVFADVGIPSLERRFELAAKTNPYDLKPDVLFDLLDRVTVRRTRKFVRKYYPHEVVEKPAGTKVRIKFPEPRPRRIEYDAGAELDRLFEELRVALDPDHPKLTMARYVPSSYRKKGAAEASQLALAGLLRSGLLKRFESSVHGFANTCETMANGHDAFLDLLAKGIVPTPELLREWQGDTASDEDLDDLAGSLGGEPAERYRAADLKADVEADRALLRGFAKAGRAIGRGGDPKLARLRDALRAILRQAAEDAGRHEHPDDLRKVIVFTYFEDTVNWVEPFLKELVDRDPAFAPYRGRIVSVAGQGSRGGVGRDAAVMGFAPESMDAPLLDRSSRFDLLIATDVLAEGLNLQQARHIVNYDLPWNPMRLVQRHGRIDRIGSAYAEVFLDCFFPAKQLEAMLELEERLQRKIAQAAAAIGVESPPLPDAETGDVTFADTRQEIEAIRAEQPEIFVNAGESQAMHSGEEYRQELRQALEHREKDDLYELPWGIGSGMVRGTTAGWFFCVRVLDRPFFRFVPAAAEAQVIRDPLRCLSLISCEPETPRSLPADRLPAVYDAWKRAQADVFQEWVWATDPKNLQPRIPALFREIGAHLRASPPTGMTQPELDELLRAVEAPWGPRFARELRGAFTAAGKPEERSRAVADKVRDLGLQPYVMPKPLGVVELEEVSLVCWMAVVPE
ncbi:MAG: helicase-related protein [bacterium]